MNLHDAPGAETVTLVLVDDHMIWRGGVRGMLLGTEFKVVGEASSGEEALQVVRALRPRVVLLDVRMGGGDGLDTLTALKREHPGMAVVMLSAYENPTYMARAVAAGAAGYLLKGIDRTELLAALRTVAAGNPLLRPEDLVPVLRGVHAKSSIKFAVEPDEPTSALSQREREVLVLIANGLSNQEIAALLFVAETTVKTHVKHILTKLGVSDRVQAAIWATRHAMISNPPGVDMP